MRLDKIQLHEEGETQSKISGKKIGISKIGVQLFQDTVNLTETIPNHKDST